MNIVFIPNISTGDGRNSPYHYSVKSWQKWAEQHNNVKVVEWTEPLMSPEEMKITLQRYWVHDILAENKIDYDQVLIVDADTIIHPQCRNIFDFSDGFTAVMNDGSYEWVLRSIREWGDALFPNLPYLRPDRYINGGFQITSKNEIPFYNTVKDYYLENKEVISKLSKKIKAGTDQTIINYLLHREQVPVSYFPVSYNLQDLFRKDLLHIPGHSWFPDELLFLNAGWIYHFNAIPQNPRHVSYWMERTYKELYERD